MVEARRPPPPFDLVVLTGFLGAGKTTLLNRLLKDPSLADTLVLINEFGDVGLDHLLVEAVEGDMLVLTSGCLCCTIRGDLVASLEDALKACDNGRMRPFRSVVIETTGLADPAPVLQTIMTHPYLRLRFRLKAVIALVDALVGDATLDAHNEAVKQAAMADRLVLTKTDLVVDPSARARLETRLRALNPAAPIFDAAAGEANVAVLFDGVSYDPAARGDDVRAWLNAEAYDDGHHHHHDVNRHGDSVRAFTIRHDRPVPAMAVSLFLELLLSANGSRLLRLKGLVALADDSSRPLIVHAVQHVLHPSSRLAAWPDDDETTRLVFIVQDLDFAFVEGLWAAAIGQPQIDRADLETIAGNPLSPTPGGLLS